jgi:hypothetical protein
MFTRLLGRTISMSAPWAGLLTQEQMRVIDEIRAHSGNTLTERIRRGNFRLNRTSTKYIRETSCVKIESMSSCAYSSCWLLSACGGTAGTNTPAGPTRLNSRTQPRLPACRAKRSARPRSSGWWRSAPQPWWLACRRSAGALVVGYGCSVKPTRAAGWRYRFRDRLDQQSVHRHPAGAGGPGRRSAEDPISQYLPPV